MKNTFRYLKYAVLVGATAILFAHADAAPETWNGAGGDDNWTTAANWGGTSPLTGDSLFFDGGTRLSPNNDFAGGTSFLSLTFNSGASAFILGGNGLTLSNPANNGSGTITGGGITNSSANNQAITLPLTIDKGNHIITTATGAGTLTLSGANVRNPGATMQFVQAGGAITPSGDLSALDGTGILGGWAIFGSSDYATINGGNVAAYTGYSLQAGSFTAVSGANVKLTAASGTITITPQNGTNADINTLLWGPTANSTITVGSGNRLRLGAKGGIFNTTTSAKQITVGAVAESLTAGGADNTAGEITFFTLDTTISGSANDFHVDSTLTDNGSGPVAVAFAGGSVQFGLFNGGGANSHSGGSYVIKGRVVPNVTKAFGTGPVYVFPGAEIAPPVAITNILFLSGVGTTEGSGNGALRVKGNLTISGPITLLTDAGINGNAGSTLSGVISGPGGLILGTGSSDATTGPWTIGNASLPNTYSGDTTIGAATTAHVNTMKMAVANIMPNGSGKGNLILNAQALAKSSVFDLNGKDQTINGLSSTATSPANNMVTNSAGATLATLTLGGNNATATFGGVITNNIALAKIGTGTQTLTGTNAYTGTTTISAGMLVVNGSSGSAVSVGSGALGGIGTINAAVSTTAGGAKIYAATNGLAGTLTLNSLDLSGGGACYLDVTNTHLSGNDRITATGALTLGSGTVFHINALSGTANLDVADYVLIQAGSIPSGTVNSTPVWDGATPANGGSYTVIVSGNNVLLHNSTYVGPLITAATATPASVNRLQSTLLSVTVTNGTAPYTVTVDASTIGGSASLGLVRDLSRPAGVYAYTNTVSLSGVANGNYSLLVTATDNASQTVNAFISVTVTGASLIWIGDGSGNSLWNTSSAEWQGGTIYQQGDFVRFDDTATGVNATNVTLPATLSPGGIVVSNTAGLPMGDYTFNGSSGAISGTTALVKQGSGTLTLNEFGGDGFTGGIVVGGGLIWFNNSFSGASGGLTVTNGTAVLDGVGTIAGNTIIGSGATVQIGNNDAFGSLPSGTVTMNGSLVFDRPDNITVGNVIGGASTGTLVQSNATSTVTLGGANTFAGNISVVAGTLSNNVVAANNGSTGGFGASTAPGRMITVGPGATINGGLNNWFGNPQVIDANLPSIVIEGGTVFSKRYTSIGSVTLNNGATLIQSSTDTGTFGGYQVRGTITVGGASASTIASGNGNADHLSTNTVFNVAMTSGSGPDLTVSAGLRNQSGDFGNSAGGFTKTGAGTMLLTASNSYTGNTTINAGTLALGGAGSISNSPAIIIATGATFDVSSLSPSFVLMPNQTLSNSTSTGVINGNANVSAGTNSLAYSGTPSLMITNGTLTLASGTVFKINNTASALAAGSYKIISRAGSGNAGSVGGTAPSTVAVAGGGIVSGGAAALSISNNELYLVISGGTPSTPRITGVSLSGTTLTITATNGVNNGAFVLLQSADLALPLNQWTPVLTNAFDGTGSLNLSTNIINPGNPRRFYILKQ